MAVRLYCECHCRYRQRKMVASRQKRSADRLNRRETLVPALLPLKNWMVQPEATRQRRFPRPRRIAAQGCRSSHYSASPDATNCGYQGHWSRDMQESLPGANDALLAAVLRQAAAP